jgi:hypothetical protein
LTRKNKRIYEAGVEGLSQLFSEKILIWKCFSIRYILANMLK